MLRSDSKRAAAGIYESTEQDVQTFTAKNSGLIEKLKNAPSQTTLELRDPCPNHSVCIPFPVFRVYRVNEDEFAAE